LKRIESAFFFAKTPSFSLEPLYFESLEADTLNKRCYLNLQPKVAALKSKVGGKDSWFPFNLEQSIGGHLMNIEIANRLVELRKKSGLSQEELAAKLGLSRQAVSKWERAEASPDTDNLICLAKLYGVSLDDLLDTDQSVDEIVEEQVKPEQEEKKKETAEEAQTSSTEQEKAGGSTQEGTSETTDSKKRTSEVHIDSTGIHFRDGKDEGSIDSSGIHVTSGKKTVDIDPSGIHVNPDDRYSKERERKHRYDIAQSIVSSVVALLTVVAYVLLGTFLPNPRIGWGTCWLVFFLIPLASSFVEALKKRSFCAFAFPVLVAGLYVLFGMLYGAWHPEWVMFLAIPIYYSIFSPIDKVIRGHWSIDFKGSSDDDDDDKNQKDDDNVIDVDVK
jgi:transcriptional regulator with XRE-family HTH domain